MDDLINALDSAVTTGLADGIVLGVRVGERVDTHAAGRRGPGGKPLTDGTPFPVCSITKPATSALLHALAADGLLDLDAPVLGAATVRSLLRHTGGVGPDWGGDLEALGNGDGALAAYAARPDLIEDLGAPWSYGNPGYWLVGHRAAVAAGTTFEAALRERVLAPAGMTGADCRPWADDASLLAHDDADPRRSSYLSMPRARISSGGVRATVHDVLALAAATWPGGALGDLGVLGAADFADAYGDRLWGPGWEAWRAADGTVVAGHSGVYGGFRTRLWSVPSRRTAVAVLAVGRGSEDVVLDVATRAIAASTGLEEPRPAIGDQARPLADYAGTYARRSARHEVSVDGEALRVTTGGETVLARPAGNDRFLVDGTVSPRRHVDFLPGASGAVAFIRPGLLAARRVS
ncbi:serine hydrolase domain-containing protein [Phytomonospora sp. NPDC050363]|uniref:serine hydrolase domain-containing protein n=1 Tax=Phytomonospora sp. NPDC050363 TaxID=3155642 RepID=UPI0033D2E8ED